MEPMGRRILIIGNSGAGKSWLREKLSGLVRSPGIDLDSLHWEKAGVKRDEMEARRLVSEAACGDVWVIESVYGWLAEVAAPRANMLIWLDLSWDACRTGLQARGIAHGRAGQDLWCWAQDYWSRKTSSSFEGHARIFYKFGLEKHRLCSRTKIEALLTLWETSIQNGSAVSLLDE